MKAKSDKLADSCDPVAPLTVAEWDAFYKANALPLYRYLLRLSIGNRNEAEDHLQETFLRAWRWLQDHPRDAPTLRPWLFTVARRIAIDAARARYRRPTDVIGDDVSALADTDDDIDRFVQAHVIRSALRELSPDHRAALVELYYHQHTAREAASVLGVPEGTIKSRAHYALRALHAATTELRRPPGNATPAADGSPGQHRSAIPQPRSDPHSETRRAPATVG